MQEETSPMGAVRDWAGECDPPELEAIARQVPGGERNVQDIHPLSSLQEGMLFHRLLNATGDTYILSTLFELSAGTDPDVLRAAVQQVIARHESLRSGILWEGLRRPVQVVYREAALKVEELATAAGGALEQLRERMRPGRVSMDLRQAPLVRLLIARDEPGARSYALLQVHHIVCDHQSLKTLVSEALMCLQGREHELPPSVPCPVPVSGASANVAAEAFFRAKLAEVGEPTAPFGLRDVHRDGRGMEETHQNLDAALARKVRHQAWRLNVSAARVFHAAWALVVARTSGRDDVVFGSVFSTLRRSRVQGRTLGMSVNTLPVRLRLRGTSAVGLVDLVHRELLDLSGFEEAPLTLVQRCSALPATAPLFTALLNYRHSSRGSDVEQTVAAGVRVLFGGEAWANYPVSVTVDDLGDAFCVTAQADGSIGAARMIAYLRAALQSLVHALENAPDTPACLLPVLPEQEWQLLLNTFGCAPAADGPTGLVHEIFERQVDCTPRTIAVTCGPDSLTYDALNRKANQLARFLREAGVAPQNPVALCLGRSLDLVVGVLGVLKAGAAYLPLDPEYPADRLQYMLEDARAKIVLTQSDLQAVLPQMSLRTIVLDREWSAIASRADTNLDRVARDELAESLAYVIYTSGSTGRPKGVMIQHGNVVNLWHGLERIYAQCEPCQRVALNASLNFDASVQQLVQLLSGRTLVVVPHEARRDASILLRLLREARIDGIDCTPSQLRSWIAAGLFEPRRHALKLVLVGGEPIDAELWNTLAACSDTEFFNVYGPTECTVDATAARLKADRSAPHVGRPMSGRRLYILDHHEQPVPVGVAGEIHIGGEGLSRGYLNLPELSAQRFVRDPFRAAPARVYKTGDLARWRNDGNIEYLGRNDGQVKIRGFRIELGEIEAQLMRHGKLEHAVVAARAVSAAEKRLIAYVVPSEPDLSVSVEELRAYLAGTLPDYMVPRAFVFLPKMPLTPSGKVDHRALPAPQLESYATREYEPPAGEVECTLAGIWQGALGLDRIGRHDNFFELGGHSLLVVQVIDRLHQAGLSAEIRHVFESPTLADLAQVLTRHADESVEVGGSLIPPGTETITPQMLPLVQLGADHIARIAAAVPGGAANIEDIQPLVPLQEGILFHHLLDEEHDVYAVPTLLSVKSRERLEELISVLQTLIDRHDVLRTAVLWEQLPQAVQVVYREAILPVEWISLDRGLDAAGQIEALMGDRRQRLDLRRAPLVRLQIAEQPPGGWYVLLQLHHMVADNTSLGILSREIAALLTDRAAVLTAPVPYRKHVARVLAYARAGDAPAFFKRKLADVDEPTAPFGILDVRGDGSRIREAKELLETALAAGVRAHARRLGVSPATLFHAAWALVVASAAAREDVVFGSVLAGRLRGGEEAQRMPGLLINTLPVRMNLAGLTARELIQATQRELAELLQHEQASLASAQSCTSMPASTPLFTALLNYRHTSIEGAAAWLDAPGIAVLATRGITNYPITVSVDDFHTGFAITAQTDRGIEPHRLTAYLTTALRSLIEALARAPQTQALALDVVPEDERSQIVERFNATQAPHRRDAYVHQLVEEQVRRSPEAIAVAHGPLSLTYAELDCRANRLARYLRARGVQTGEPVGICVERSLDMVVGLLAILKAGGAYLPLDPSYPQERLRHMLEDAAPRFVVTQTSLQASLPAERAEWILLDRLAGTLDSHPADALSGIQLAPPSSHLLYVIYTSGSTGRPKGTAMPHGAMVNLIEWHRRCLPLRREQRVLQFAALSFDVAFQETFSTLCDGGTLVLLDECVRKDARALLTLLDEESIERLFAPPLVLQSLAECAGDDGVVPGCLRDIITAGEQLRISPQIVRFFERLDACRLHNHYGPTETHVVTALTLNGTPQAWPSLPTIGRPIDNTQIYLLDSRRKPVPRGAIGEIHLAGANVACGYLNRPELTAERFLPDSLGGGANGRMYKTGDLGRWQADGTLEYLGRNDDQVKIRGYRIELGEIEAQLALHAEAKDVAVVARDDGAGVRRLVAYVTPRDGASPRIEELRSHLKALVPGYMVPGAIVVMDRFPLTPSGKLNRRALPAPHDGAYSKERYEPLKGAIEEALGGIWRDVLHVAQIGRRDDFFELGGHSLLALNTLLKINQQLGCALRVADLYRSPTPEGLAARIRDEVVADDFIDLQKELMPAARVASPRPAPRRIPPRTVLLTGATGFVGRFLLRQLLEDTGATVYCLVRGHSAHEAMRRLRGAMLKWDLWRNELESRLVAIPGDLRLARLGLSDQDYGLLSEDIDDIYHCGASMNHLESYAMAKPANVGGASELLNIAARGRCKLINYISTLGVFSALGHNADRLVSEQTPIDGERHPTSHGYVASKWVAEKIFLNAREHGVPCNIFRIGLVGPDVRLGRYDELQREYRILKSGLLSGFGIENYRPQMPPTPVDYVARSVVFLATRHCHGGGVFHVSGRNQVQRGLFERCNEIVGTALRLLPLEDWVRTIRKLHEQGASLPVVTLIESAFATGAETLREYQQSMRSARVHHDCSATHRELELAGIHAPVFGDEALLACIESMRLRDEDVRNAIDTVTEAAAKALTLPRLEAAAYEGARERV